MSSPPIDTTPASERPAPASPAPWLRVLGLVPMPVMYTLAWLLALFMRHVLRYRVAVVRENLRLALPELDTAARERVLGRQYHKLTEVLFELPWLTIASRPQVSARVRLPDLAAVRAELAAGRPVLLLAAHLCNWEWLLQALAIELGVPFVAAYKPPHSERTDELLLSVRSRFGTQMVPAKRLLRQLLRLRGTAHAVGMVADQMPTSSGGRVWLSFLGRPTAFFPGPAEIARLGGYRAYFLAQRRLRRGYYETHFEPIGDAGEALDVATFTARYAARVEALVRERPEEWAWTHRRWKLQPPAELAAAGQGASHDTSHGTSHGTSNGAGAG
jgi:KDO2-lipid IV(A) lauroyltransferase